MTGDGARETINLETVYSSRDVSPEMARDWYAFIKDMSGLIVAALIAMAVMGFLMVQYPSATSDTQGKVMATLTSLASSAVGYIFGKKA